MTDPHREEEEILDESTSEDERIVRVYDHKGDFTIKVPAGAKITFGYFNPAAPRDMVGNERGYGPGPNNVARQTALRIYERGEKGNQLACFIGVLGFRDDRIKLTRLQQRVVIERNLSDDGEGNLEWGGKEQRQLIAAPELDVFQ
jgi:hypothetical protein